MKAGKFGIISALLASACCIGPLVLAAIGLGAGAAFFGRYHWFFLIAAMAVLTWAWTRYLKEKTVCDCEHKPMERRKTSLYTLMFATAVVVAFFGLNVSRYIFGSSAPPPSAIATEPVGAGLQRVVIPVEGMSCAACEIAINSALKRLPGLKSARASVAGKSATVEYDPAQTSLQQIVDAINATGYRAVLPQK